VVCPQKETISSTDLADLISNLNLNGFSSINFIILPDRYILLDSWKNLNFAKDTDIKYFAVSSFNLKGDLTAVVLSEQLYRAYTIMNNITYHK
jgi:23S rRNA (pseudouridine1915-N3)-methyltransferase